MKRMFIPNPLTTDGLVHYETQCKINQFDICNVDEETHQDLPTIYIVIPTYNSGATLEKTIRSLLLQKYPSLQIAVYDGGSSDDSTLPILRHYAAYLDVIISKPDEGQSDVINKGFECAPNDSVLGWLNADDILLPGALAYLSKAILENDRTRQVSIIKKPAMFVGDADLVDQDLNLIHPKRLSEVKLSTEFLIDYRNNYIIQPSCFFTKRLWDLAGPNNPDLYAAFDFELFYKMSALAEVKLHIPYVMSYSVFHEDCKTVKQRHLSISETALVQAREGGFHHALREIQDLSKEYKFLERVLSETKYTKPAILISITEFGLGGAQTYLLTLMRHIHLDFRIYLYRHWTHRTSTELLNEALRYCQDITPYINYSVQGMKNFLEAQGIKLVLSNLFHSDLHMANVCRGTSTKLVVVDHGDYRFVVEDNHASLEDVLHIFSTAYKFIYTAEVIKRDALLRYFSSGEKASRKLEYIPLPCETRKGQLSPEALCAALDLPLNTFLVAYSGRGIVSKGWGYAIEAVARANEVSRRPIALIGMGSGEALDALSAQINGFDNSLNKFIRLLGFRSDSPSIAAACHCSMMLSFYPGETLNLTLIEALMAGNPCIATEWGAMGEVLRFGFDDAAGLPIPVFKGIPVVAEVSRSLCLLSSDLTEYSRLKRYAEERSHHYSARRVCKIYSDFLLLWMQ